MLTDKLCVYQRFYVIYVGRPIRSDYIEEEYDKEGCNGLLNPLE